MASGQQDKTAGKARRRKPRPAGRKAAAWRWLKRLAIAAIVVAAIPLVLTFVYAIPAVHPVSMLMLKDAVTLQGYDRRWTSLDDLGMNVVNAVMMSEDGQFCSHYGVDLGELHAVVEDALSGEEVRGASTIPMQTVKNLFLWQDRSYVRKALELPLAIYFDAVLSKKRIMEIYLNIAEWGPDQYGAEAAAQFRFGKHARDLSHRQAALLAVTLPNPAERNPAKPSAEMLRVAKIVERRARIAGDYNDCLE